MGAWGEGSFDNDTALDILYDFSQALSTQISKGLRDKSAAEWDEYACDKLVVDIEIFLALAGKLPLSNFPSSKETREAWDLYADRWKQYTRGEGEFLEVRRYGHIKSLVERLVAVCEAHESRLRELMPDIPQG